MVARASPCLQDAYLWRITFAGGCGPDYIPVLNDTIKPYLAAIKNSAEGVEKMHPACCKPIQIQLALRVGPNADPGQVRKESLFESALSNES